MSEEQGIELSPEDARRVVLLRKRVAELTADQYQEAWECRCEVLRIVNQSTLQKLCSGNFQSDEVLMFTEIPTLRPEPGQHTGVHLELLLIKDSPLTNEILELLKKHGEASNGI